MYGKYPIVCNACAKGKNHNYKKYSAGGIQLTKIQKSRRLQGQKSK